MLRSMYSGISGMKVNQVKLDVIGNNLANVGTTAFKCSRTRFQDMLYQSEATATGPSLNVGGTNGQQVGLGVKVSGIDRVVTQGMMQPTGRNLDVAMDGNSYFMVARGENTSVVKLKADYNGIDNGAGMEIKFSRDGAFALDEQGNLLNSDGYRVLGYVVKAGAGKDSIEHDKATGKPTCNFVDADAKPGPKAEENKLVPLAIPDVVKDGAGKDNKIISFSIEKDGQLKAVLEDGKVSILGQIAMASFKNPEGLKTEGKNLYTNSANSGEPRIRAGIGGAADKTKGFGDMVQGVLEMSNVDIAAQFTDMIVANRSFQASSKMISTGDEILQDIINLKR